MYERYAIFYTAAPGPFAEFGAAWLGWDSAAAHHVTHPALPGLDVKGLTKRPRKYGFHATLKAPFHLAKEQTDAALLAAVKEFASIHAPVPLGELEISKTHGFVALRPSAAPTELRRFAATVVTEFDRFRAPMNDEDIARRRKARLTPRQDQQMLDWGYPFVFEDFNFHMTLTGSLKRAEMETVLPLIKTLVAPSIPPQVAIDAITLMGQDGDGLFHQIHRASLIG